MLFINNKYTKWYHLIILSANEKPHKGYTEKHHILPKCLGGSNDKTNIAVLSARQHFICHLLLTKMTIGQDKHKMIYAAHFLAKTNKGGKTGNRKYKVNNRLYEKLSIAQAKIYLQQNIGKTISDETKKKISIAHTGKIVSDETRQKMGAARKGSVHSKETKQHLSNIAKQRHEIYVSCVKCKITIDYKNYCKLHGDNCGKPQPPAWNSGIKTGPRTPEQIENMKKVQQERWAKIRKERDELYFQNPSYCNECNKPLSYRKRNKDFCNGVCSRQFKKINKEIKNGENVYT